jgi:hypothetical protein
MKENKKKKKKKKKKKNSYKTSRVTSRSTPTHFRATSYTRLTARDHHTSSTLIGGKGGAGPSLLHTMREGPTE